MDCALERWDFSFCVCLLQILGTLNPTAAKNVHDYHTPRTKEVPPPDDPDRDTGANRSVASCLSVIQDGS